MIVIFSYNRPNMLMSLLKELQGKDEIIVMDDGSDYDPFPYVEYCDYYRSEHMGKEGFWAQWQSALYLCNDSGHDWFVFLQDDLKGVRYDKLREVTENLDTFAFNVVNMGRDRGWTRLPWINKRVGDLRCQKMGYVDCIFATNRNTLDLLDWTIHPVAASRFINPLISSGVGQQLSRRFAQLNVPMYLPRKSLAYHGDHESEMHPIERKRTPFISV